MTGQPRSRAGLVAALIATTALAGLALPAFGQQSILPPGIGQPAPAPKDKESKKDEPRKDAPKKGDSKDKDPAPETPREPVTLAPAAPPPVSPLSSGGGEGGGVVESSTLDDAAADEASETITRVRRYDLPPGSRRSLDRIGLITETDGGFAANAFGNAGGNYLAILMDKTNAPIVSRWASILLRRALVSAVDTPSTINGADLTAARASLLNRMGEAALARDLVQSVDPDRATPRLFAAALDAFMANGDPAGLCPLVPGALRGASDGRWQLARGMCTALAGDAGTAGAFVDRAGRQKDVEAIDRRLAEKILGASVNGRRAIKIEWDGVDSLTPWRFGLATATGVELPTNLMKDANSRYRSWSALAPMTPLDTRLASAAFAAEDGVLSNRGYVSLVSAAYAAEDRPDTARDAGQALRNAYAAPTLGDRMSAMKAIWDKAKQAGAPYGGYVETARAAAQLPPSDGLDVQFGPLIASMLSAGFDRNAANWARFADKGSEAWALLAVGAPTALNNVDSGGVSRFSKIDQSQNYHRSKMLIAGLAGLGRIDQSNLRSAAGSFDFDLNGSSDWIKAIDRAAEADQPATVALLAAVGLQGSGWDKVNPLHLYHVTAALKRVGLEPEARMIAAEAVARS